MISINEVSINHIRQLTAPQLAKLLRLLLTQESLIANLPSPDIFVPDNILSADGGEDGYIKWINGPERTFSIPNRYTVFQNKAFDLTPANCVKELLIKKKKKKGTPPELKPRIKELVEQGGAYVLFTTAPYTNQQKSDRIDSFRGGLKKAGIISFAIFPIEIYDANRIATWANQYISAVTEVQRFCGIDRPSAFETWSSWNRRSMFSLTPYKMDDILSGHVAQISSSISIVNKMRISGHSGLGKTRLVHEAFRNHQQSAFIIYYDLEGVQSIQQIKDYIISYQESQKGILIIDNCSVKSHLILSKTIDSSNNFKLISIGFDESEANEDAKIRLYRNNQFGIVEAIVNEKLGSTHDTDDIAYVNSVSEGYPWMAERFCKKILETGLKNFSALIPEEFYQKLLFGGESKEIEFELIRACSVFSSFGFPDDEFRSILPADTTDFLKSQVEYIRTEILESKVTYTQFYEICQKYRREDIIERHGSYYMVKPAALAITLAANWLLATDRDKVKKIIFELQGKELAIKIVERLTDLDQVSKAAELVGELWGPNGFFGTAEVLNTAWGSLLFRNAVEVNPLATASALQASFSLYSIEELLGIVEARRNLVWSLEKLVFRKKTFLIAGRILLSFAAAENENWSNNATNQFLQLYHVYLPGTEMSLLDRLPLLNWGLEKQESTFTKLVILAIGQGLRIGHPTRMGGAESQGGGPPLKDYNPSGDEIFQYWKSLFGLITPLAVMPNELGELARHEIAQSIRELVHYGFIDPLFDSIRFITQIVHGLWKDALNAFAMTIKYEHPTGEILQKIEDIIEHLKPNDLRNKLYFNVIERQWDLYEVDDSGNYIDRPRQSAEDLADDISRKRIDLSPFYTDLLTGDQQQTFSFAARLSKGSKITNNLISDLLKIIKSIPIDKRNPSFIGGLLHGASDDELFIETMKIVMADSELALFAFYLTSNYHPITIESLGRLFEVIDHHAVPISSFKIFQYGSVLNHLSNQDIVALCTRISKYGVEGVWTALNLSFMISFSNNSRWSELKVLFKDLILTENLLLHSSTTGVSDAFHWKSTVVKIIEEESDDEFSKAISHQIIGYCSKQRYSYAYETEVFDVIQKLFDYHFDAVWPIYGSCLIGPWSGYFHLKNLFWVRDMNNAKSTWLFDNENRGQIVAAWTAKNGEIAPKRIASILPIDATINEKITWHPFTRNFIEKFGTVPGVLNEISANMGTFGSSGSTVGYYSVQKIILEELLDSSIVLVQDWARAMLKFTEDNIKRSHYEDENDRTM